MPLRFSAQHRYQEILTIFQRWPGIGNFSAKRLFQAGSSQKQFVSQLKRLSQIFEQLAPCPLCLIPQMASQECHNCATSEQYSKILLIAEPSDAFVLQSFRCLSSYYFLSLPAYLSHHSPVQAIDRQLNHIIKILESRPIEHCLILFNQSLEARSTLWMLKKRAPEGINWKDASSLSLDKDNIGSFSDLELKMYEQQLEEYLSSK